MPKATWEEFDHWQQDADAIDAQEEVMTKTKTTHREHKETKTIREVLEEIKTELLALESSSSHGEFRAACQNAIAVIEKHLGHE